MDAGQTDNWMGGRSTEAKTLQPPNRSRLTEVFLPPWNPKVTEGVFLCACLCANYAKTEVGQAVSDRHERSKQQLSQFTKKLLVSLAFFNVLQNQICVLF